MNKCDLIDRCDTCDKPIGGGMRWFGLIPETSVLLCMECDRQIEIDAAALAAPRSKEVH